MQKVVGSSPIIRSPQPAGNGGFFAGHGPMCRAAVGVRQRLGSVWAPLRRNLGTRRRHKRKRN
jgi:hypothetical protein